MNPARICYRTQQFWETLTARWRPVDAAYVVTQLPPALLDLFMTMSPAEQHHSIALAKALEHHARTSPDLITAALLHDVGKTLVPPRLWERVAIVLVEYFVPTPAAVMDKAWFGGLKRAYVTRTYHAAWGAELVAEAGASSRTVSLIRRHHEPGHEDEELTCLQQADDTYE